MENVEVKEAKGKLGVLIVGVGGAVSSTFITGTLSVRKGIGIPIGSLIQLATILKNTLRKIIGEPTLDYLD
jgi:myo-inositol-1-phosphate synthase